ncbi:putative chromatin regulator PHD family [Helianthus anomalus]
MDQGYKHFSHLHNLVMHQMPEGTEVSCSGCHSSATGTVYVCWQCNFFLHDQCYRATRSLKHPSHPPHSLTLVPYPTYPSNSFYCDSCRIKGTGFSYSCADCEFDLHVQCAYSISGATNWNGVHNLSIVNLNKENKVVCSGCEENLIGKGFSCSEPNCDFHLHESRFHLKNEIQHKSHPGHPLKLLPFAPYNNKNREFACSACFGNGRGFTYHCSVCEFDLHVQCVSLPETVKRADHEHALKLFYSCPVKGEEFTVSCDVCQGAIQKDRWAYYCESCDFETHLDCVKGEKRERDSVMDTQVQLQRLQLEMQMNQQLAQMIAGMGASIASLAP